MGAYGSPELPNRPAKLSRRKPAGLRRAFWRGYCLGMLAGALALAGVQAVIIVTTALGTGR